MNAQTAQRAASPFYVVKGSGFDQGGFATLSISGYEFPAQQIAREHFVHDDLVGFARTVADALPVSDWLHKEALAVLKKAGAP